MSSFVLGLTVCLFPNLGGLTFLKADKPFAIANVHGGLVVQLGAGETETAARLSRTGRYVIHVLDTDPSKAKKARKALKTGGVYGIAT